MPFNIRYVDVPPEGYKAVTAKKDGETQKYKMRSIKNSAIEYPNKAIIQSITKRFMTQRNLEPIYSAAYGVDWAKFVGRDMTNDLALAIEQEVHDAIMTCKFVDNVNVDVSAVDGSKVLVNCEVTINSKYTVSKKNETTVIGTTLNVGEN